MITNQETVDRLLNPVIQLINHIELPPDSFLFSRLYGVFCSAFVYLPEYGINCLVKKGLFDQFMKALMSRANSFTTTYDRRLFILAMLSVFKLKLKQEQIDEIAIGCLESAVLHLHVQRMEEEKKLSGDTIKTNHTKGAISRKGPLNDTDRQDIAVYNMTKGKSYNLSEVLMDDEDGEQDEIMEFLVSANREAQRSIQNLSSPIKEIDEFNEFSTMFVELKNFFQEKLNSLIVDKLTSSAKIVLPGILQCKKISTVTNEKLNEVEVMPRKIVKVRPRAMQAQN
jgi:hypothetical protein